MRQTLKAIRSLAIALVLVGLPAMSFAQGDARFTGTVLDQTGAFVPGATVTVKNQRTGEERTAVSTMQGRYVIANLKPSSYTISVSFGSFAPLEHELVATEAHTSALHFRERKSPRLVEVEDLVGRGELVRVATHPVDNVVPLVHAAPAAIIRPRPDVVARPAAQDRRRGRFGFRGNRHRHGEW